MTANDGPQVAPDPGRVTRAEVALLGALLFVLPLFEVPKHLLWLAWVGVSAAGWWRERAARRLAGLAVQPWGVWDSAFAALLLLLGRSADVARLHAQFVADRTHAGMGFEPLQQGIHGDRVAAPDVVDLEGRPARVG